MISASPTVLTFEANSAWILILAVSSVTLLTTWALRRVLSRPGGMYSGLLLLLPLLLPLIAALVHQSGVLPEISVLKPAGAALADQSEALLRLLRITDGSGTSAFYAISGSPGSWLIVFGGAVTSFMLARRVLGRLMVRRLIARCEPVTDPELLGRVEHLAARAGLARHPETLTLPEHVSGAFATGTRRHRILISEDLLAGCGPDELDGILAHEIAHLEARDVPLTLLSGFLRDVVAWNPVAHLAHRKLCTDREYEADRRAADLTGDPLAVASGLLKAVELMRGRTGFTQRNVLALLGPGRLIARRVKGLISVADGRTSVMPSGHLPFLVAGFLVALVGLEVGERVAAQGSSLAIVWGDPSPAQAGVWEAPAARWSGGKKSDSKATGMVRRSKPRGKADLQRPVRLLGFSEAIRVKETDLEVWMGMVDRRVQRAGLQAATVRWEARRQYQAVPIVTRLPIGIYRIDREM